MKFVYRVIRFLNRYITFTPEFRTKVSRSDFISRAMEYVHFPYVLWWDWTNKQIGLDCSHLISRALIDCGAVTPSFYRTAQYLKNLTLPIDQEASKPWDLLFFLDESGRIYHVAIIIEVLDKNQFRILDASWPSTGIWSTIVRDVNFNDSPSLIGKPFFFLD